MSGLAPGQRFGAYVIEARAGEGGMGTVYRARDTSLGRLVALKVIRTGGEDGPAADVVARFLREARVGASLSHPNIVVVYEASAIGECPYLAMEWIDGTSLAHHMVKGTLPSTQRIDVLETVADALSHAHGRGVIHRDVKPTNVMIDAAGGRARLVDFGIAKPTTITASPATMMLPTHARQVLGTPAYMAPEQMLSPSVDARADQYSWGVMAYEVLAGRHPADTVPPGGSAFPVAKPQPLGWVKPEVPDAIAAVVHRAMSYEPGARFTGMAELLFALRAARRGAGPDASYPPGAFGSAPTVSHTQGTIGSTSTIGAIGVPPTLDTRSSHPSAVPQAAVFATTPMHPSLGPGPMAIAPPSRGVPVIALVAILAFLFLGGGIAVAAVVLTQTSGAGGSPGASPISVPISLGPKKAFIESGMSDLKFAAGGDPNKAKADLEAKLTPCYASPTVTKEKSFRATVHVANDGKVTKIEELNVCQEQHPSFYLCTERADLKKPKRGFPVVADDVFACMEKALLSTRFPKLVPDGEPTQDADLHIELR
ncbi:MAG: protein kinase [Labilithrix sp.]|nr:protein kinase [Labilithrix sp.]